MQQFKSSGSIGFAAVGAVALLWCAGGCASGDGSGSGGGTSAAILSASVHESWAEIGYRLDWQGFAPVPRGERVTDVEVASEYVVVQDSSSAVTVLEKGDGSLRWSNQLATRLTKFVGVHGTESTVWAMSQGELIGMDVGSGAITTRQTFARVVNTAPLVSGGVAVFGTPTGEVLAHLTSNGVKLWGFQTPGAITAPPVDVDGVAAVVSQSGDVVFLDPQSGTLYGRGRMFDGIASRPVSGDGAVYVAGLDQSLWAFEASGAVRWRYRTEHALRSQPVYHAGSVYCPIPGQGLVCLDARSGRTRWSSAEAGGTVVAERNGMLVVHHGGEVLLIDARDGGIVERESIPDVAMIVAEGFTDGALYAVSRGGSVSRFIARR